MNTNRPEPVSVELPVERNGSLSKTTDSGVRFVGW